MEESYNIITNSYSRAKIVREQRSHTSPPQKKKLPLILTVQHGMLLNICSQNVRDGISKTQPCKIIERDIITGEMLNMYGRPVVFYNAYHSYNISELLLGSLATETQNYLVLKQKNNDGDLKTN